MPKKPKEGGRRDKMSFSRKLQRQLNQQRRTTMARYIHLKVTDEDRENIKKRGNGKGENG